MTRAALDALIGKWSPKILWVTLSLVIPFTVTTSYRVGAEVKGFEVQQAQHEALDTLILRRLEALDAKVDRGTAKTDSVRMTVDSLRWLMLDRERRSYRFPMTPLRPGTP